MSSGVPPFIMVSRGWGLCNMARGLPAEACVDYVKLGCAKKAGRIY